LLNSPPPTATATTAISATHPSQFLIEPPPLLLNFHFFPFFNRKGSDYSDADSVDVLAATAADKDEDDRATPPRLNVNTSIFAADDARVFVTQ
jgi:hypothetical protein